MSGRNHVAMIDALLRDEFYSRSNVFAREYTEDSLKQILKHHYEFLESKTELDEDLRVIWIDIQGAIDALPEAEARVVRAYAEGFRATALTAEIGQRDVAKVYDRGVRLMIAHLNGEGDKA